MPSFIRAQVSIPSDTTVPADIATNTFHFQSALLSVQDTIDSAQGKLTTFYAALDVYLSAVCATPATVKYYDLTDSVPRVPVDTETITLTTSASATIPTEVAVCISYSAAAVSGQPQARRRGRLFFGPIDSSGITTGSGRVTVSGTFMTALANAASGLAGGSLASEAVWSVFSPTAAGPAPWSEGALEASMNPIASGYVDNAFDTQRSRGTAATVRQTWTA